MKLCIERALRNMRSASGIVVRTPPGEARKTPGSGVFGERGTPDRILCSSGIGAKPGYSTPRAPMRTRGRQHVDLNPVVPRPRRLSRDVPSPASGGFLPAGPIAARTAPRCDAGSAPSRWGSCRSKMRCGHSAAIGALGKCGHTSLFRCMVVRRRSGSPPRRNARTLPRSSRRLTPIAR